MTLRERILASADLPLHPVPVPEWDATVYLRPLNVRERTALLDAKADEAELQLRAVLAGCCDEDGTPLFQPSDREPLLAKNGAVVERLAKRILHAAFPKVGDLEKN